MKLSALWTHLMVSISIAIWWEFETFGTLRPERTEAFRCASEEPEPDPASLRKRAYFSSNTGLLLVTPRRLLAAGSWQDLVKGVHSCSWNTMFVLIAVKQSLQLAFGNYSLHNCFSAKFLGLTSSVVLMQLSGTNYRQDERFIGDIRWRKVLNEFIFSQ